MLPFLFMTIFMAVAVTANDAAGKFQALFFYQLYRLDIDANGLSNSRMAPGCKGLNGGPCNMEQFIREVCVTKRGPDFGADGKPIKGPDGKPILHDTPDWTKPDWPKIGEGEDRKFFGSELDKSGFKGEFHNARLFKDWKQKNTFATVMSEAEDIGKKAIDKLKADGRDPLDDRLNKVKDALKTHADARRYDQANKIKAAFEKEFTKNGITISYTNPIERPPVPGYEKIDTDKTINDNMGKVGFDKLEAKIRDYVGKFNSAKLSVSHIEAIVQTDNIHLHLPNSCT